MRRLCRYRLCSKEGQQNEQVHTFSHSVTLTVSSAAYVLTRDSANDITITQMFITLAIMLEVY